MTFLDAKVGNYSEVKTPGSYSVIFDGSDLASGVYFYRLVVGDACLGTNNTNNGDNFMESKKMVLIK